jgi:hypothetical protein
VEAGRLLRRDLLRAHRRQPKLVREEKLGEREAGGDDEDEDRAGARGEQRSHEGHVEKAEQEQREQHPELETGVAREDGLLGSHELKISQRGHPALALDFQGAILAP